MIKNIEIKIKGKINKKEFKSLNALQNKLAKKYKQAEISIHYKNPPPNSFLY